MRKPRLNRRGFTLIEIMLVVLIIAILSALAVPNFMQARESSLRCTCIANLKLLDSAKEEWALATGKDQGTTVAFTDLVGTNGHLKSEPTCPSGGTYTLNAVGTNPICSISEHVLP